MKKLEFNIYIGSKMVRRQGANIVAVVILPPEIPRGHFNVDGVENNECEVGFSHLSHLANYMNDWIELLEEENCIKANIYLKKYSVKKVFRGKSIVEILDKISNCQSLIQINDFKDIEGGKK